MQHRHNANRKIPRDAAADLEKSDRRFFARWGIPVRERDHVFDPGAHGVDIFHVPFDAVGGIHVAECRIFPAGHKHRKILLFGREEPTVFRINLEAGLQFLGIQNAPEKLVREKPLATRVGVHPFLEDHILDPPHRLHFRDARVGHTVHVAVQQRLLVRRSEVAIIRQALVKIMRHEIENILFEVRSCADDSVDFPLPDHLGEREP